MDLEANRLAYNVRLDEIRAGWEVEVTPPTDLTPELTETALLSMAIHSAEESAS